LLPLAQLNSIVTFWPSTNLAFLKAEKQRSSGRSCFRIAEKFYSAALPAARPTARYAAAAPPSSEMKYRRKFIDRRKCIPVVQALTVATLFPVPRCNLMDNQNESSIQKPVTESDQRILAQRARINSLEANGRVIAAEKARHVLDEMLSARGQLLLRAKSRKRPNRKKKGRASLQESMELVVRGCPL